MEEHLRIAVCFWHSFNWPGSDVFGSGTFDRPWLAGTSEPMTAARDKLEAAFEFLDRLGVPYFTFHDRDVAPEGRDLAESRANLDAIVGRHRAAHGAHRDAPAVGHRQPVQPSALRGRRRDEPRSGGVRPRRGPGLRHARHHPSARRRELRPVGRPRGLRDAPQHRPEARGGAARPVPAPRGGAQAPHRFRRERCSWSPSPRSRRSTSTTTTSRPSTPSSAGMGWPTSTASTSRRTTPRSPGTASTTRSPSRSRAGCSAAST